MGKLCRFLFLFPLKSTQNMFFITLEFNSFISECCCIRMTLETMLPTICLNSVTYGIDPKSNNTLINLDSDFLAYIY